MILDRIKDFMDKHQQRRGFTLIELLTVVAIIGLLVGMFSVAGIAARRAYLKSNARTELQEISTALQEYRLEKGCFPASLDSSIFDRLPKAVRERMGNRGGSFMDPWRLNAYEYSYNAASPDTFVLFSKGDPGNNVPPIYPGK